jgi:hypothetical protein
MHQGTLDRDSGCNGCAFGGETLKSHEGLLHKCHNIVELDALRHLDNPLVSQKIAHIEQSMQCAHNETRLSFGSVKKLWKSYR